MKNFDLGKITSTQTFFDLIGVQFRNNDHFSLRLSMWNSSGFYNRQKTFVFKYFNNLLGINVRLSHFVENQTRDCTFCSLSNRQTNDETFVHLFLECETTKNWQSTFTSKILGFRNELTMNEKKHLFFLGELPGEATDNYFLIASILLFQSLIWENKLRRKTPSFNTLQISFFELTGRLLANSKLARECAEKLNLPLCRHFGYGVRPGVRGEGGGHPVQLDRPP